MFCKQELTSTHLINIAFRSCGFEQPVARDQPRKYKRCSLGIVTNAVILLKIVNAL
jgi:hypothetical protein